MIAPSRCPICNREVKPTPGVMSADFPFCSKRCRQVDLARWMDGKYAIARELEPDDYERMGGDVQGPAEGDQSD